MYDMPMSLEEALNDEDLRRRLQEFAGPAPTPDPEGSFADLASRYMQAQEQGRQADALNRAGTGLDAAARVINAGAGFQQPSMVQRDATARDAPVKDVERLARIEALGRKAKTTAAGKPVQTDEQARAAFRARYPDASEEEVATVNAANFEAARKTAEGKAGRGVTMRGQNLTSDANTARLEQGAKQHVEEMGFKWDNLSHEDQRAAMRLEEMRLQFQMGREDRERNRAEDRAVPGFATAPGATPTPDDARKMKDTNEAALRLQGNVSDLRALHRKYGEAPKGAGAELQQQKLRAIQIEAKNIAGLGALSGPDFSLMQDLSAQDVNSIGAWIRRNFAGATLSQSLSGLEQWMRTTIAATAKARGYAPKPPARTPPSSALPKDATGQPTLDPPSSGTTRVEMKNGTILRIPISDLAEALNDPDVVGEVK